MTDTAREKENSALKKWTKALTGASKHQMKCEQCYEAIGGRGGTLCAKGKTLFELEIASQNELGEVRRKIRPKKKISKNPQPAGNLIELKWPSRSGERFYPREVVVELEERLKKALG